MDQVAIDFFRLLLQAGAIPGEDFSCDGEQRVYHLNERCHGLLQATFPDVDWLEVLGSPHNILERQILALHQQLGCDFVDQLIQLMVQRLPTLANDAAAGYVQAILVGVESATSITLFPLLQAALDLSAQARLEWLLRQDSIVVPGDICLADLLQAAGATAQDYEVQSGETWLTESGWQRLSLVWDGDCTLDATRQ